VNSQGAAAKAADIVANSYEGRLKEASNQVKDALVPVGEGAAKVGALLLGAVIPAIEAFNKLPTPAKEAAGASIAVTAGLLGLGAAGAGVLAVIPPVIAGYTTLTGALGINSAAQGANAAAATADAAALTAEGAAAGEAAIATEAAGAASVAAAGKGAGLAAGFGSMALQGGLAAAAIGAVTLAAASFVNGGQAFDDTAKKFEDDLKKIQAEADKTADKVGKLKPPDTGKNQEDPNKAQGTGFLTQASDFLTKGQIEFGPDGPKFTTNGKGVGLSEKFANDQVAGAGDESIAANKIISEAQSQIQVLKNNPNQKAFSQGQLGATKAALDDVIQSTDARIKALKPG